MAALFLFLSLVSLFIFTYVSNHRVKAPVEVHKITACQRCSNSACSNYKGGE